MTAAPLFSNIIKGLEDTDFRKIDTTPFHNEDTPLVSVWVHTFNQEKYVRECLDSILAQRVNFSYEVIIADDASTDSTPAILLEYEKRYPTVIKCVLGRINFYSTGRKRSVEQLIPLSQGKYLTCCEGDDYWSYEERMQALADFMESHPRHSLCFHAYRSKSEIAGFNVNYPRVRRARDVGALELIVEPHIQYATFMGRLDVLRHDKAFQEEYEHRIFNFYDMRIYLAFLNAGRVHAFPHYWSVYRLHANGLSTSMELTNTAEEYHMQYLHQLSQIYFPKFKNLEKMRIDFLAMQDLLNKWTYKRKHHSFSTAVLELIRAFTKYPKLFIYTYFHRYIH